MYMEIISHFCKVGLQKKPLAKVKIFEILKLTLGIYYEHSVIFV